MFQFTPYPDNSYTTPCGIAFTITYPAKLGELPHSETAGSKVCGTSPTSSAAVCVLPRSKPPGHPLLAFVLSKTLKTSSLHLSRSQLRAAIGDADPCRSALARRGCKPREQVSFWRGQGLRPKAENS